jgi:aspartyl protease family protein
MVAPVRIREMRVGDIVVRDVEAVVAPPGRLRTSLLGMSFLRSLRGFDISGGRLTLRG